MSTLTRINKLTKGKFGEMLNTPGISKYWELDKKRKPPKAGKGFIGGFWPVFKANNDPRHTGNRYHCYITRMRSNLLLDTEREANARGKALFRLSGILREKEIELANMVPCWPGYNELHDDVVRMRSKMRELFD